MSWQGPLDPPSLYQRRLDVDVNPQPPRIVTEAKLARESTEHARGTTLRFTMCTTKCVDVRVHVFLGHREELFTIFQRGFHRKLQDQTGRPVPDAPVGLLPGRAFAHGIGGLEELAPAALGGP